MIARVLIALSLPFIAAAKDLSEDYSWQPLRIGGGGYVVGMDIHPTEPDLMYVRTDVSGAYRWEPSTHTWRQIVTTESLPEQYHNYGQYKGVDSLVAAPKDPDIAYMAYRGEIFRSEDRGEHWVPTSFAEEIVTMEPNGPGRQEGERLAVDPLNSDIVFYGSINNGLWQSIDAGTTWQRIDDIPAGTPGHGVNTVLIAPTESDRDQSSKVIVTVDQVGVFLSDDTGKTWSNIADGTPLVLSSIREAGLGPDGTLYVLSENNKLTPGAVWSYNANDCWTNITPGGPEGGDRDYWGIAIDPRDAKRLVLIRQGGDAFLSEDGGNTWEDHGFALQSDNMDWIDSQETYWLSIGELGFALDGKLWLAEGFGVWWADDFSEYEIPWQEASVGIEETCGNDIIAPPGGAPVGAMWDVGVFRFPEPETYTAQRAKPYFMSAWSLDWCPADPQFLVAVFQNHLGFEPHINETGFSRDGGVTWQSFPAVADKSLPADLEYGVIAVSPQSTDNIVWTPAHQQLPYFTTDGGASWTQADFGEVTNTGFDKPYTALKPLCADRVLDSTFYFYRWEDGVYRSTDGGAHFTHVGCPVIKRYNAVLKAAPGHAGDLWLAEGYQGNPVGGLWRSQDGGETWTLLDGIEQAYQFGFGKALHEGGYPTLYVSGVKAGHTGIFRSTDQGQTWDTLSGHPLGIFDSIDAMDGDKDVFGKVYLAFTGAGFAYGELKANE